MTAGGLVFGAGTRDHKIRAFDKNTSPAGDAYVAFALPGHRATDSASVNARISDVNELRRTA